ncbi:hypothetical protein AM493_04570 [Flavobacterium akiainvivens]|uniref:Lipoprotein SmpA/OmlA domain-containing protein n=1 Tax=Flavobacterium akiainvivens TaxID=1202724 RepID=A0A0M8MGN3_9FLAO|nr:hypothetical protein [Flavobacterium akiainvivens]KOS05387.1 hypothetical protein AM493_04570 [Flavobacterium akiainvivens]SFQ73779.1 hypothetical protein SAMN05444144_11936 [Flavobacterium akiainvivens]
MKKGLKIVIVIILLPFAYVVSCSAEQSIRGSKFDKVQKQDHYSKVEALLGEPDKISQTSKDGKFWVTYYNSLGPVKYLLVFDKDSLITQKYTD